MSEIKEQNERLVESNVSASERIDHSRIRRRRFRLHKRRRQALAQIRKLLRKNDHNIRRSRRKVTDASAKMINASTQTNLTDENGEEINLNAHTDVAIETKESRAEPSESTNEQDLGPARITTIAQINSPTGAELVMFSAMSEPVTPTGSPTTSNSFQPESKFVIQTPMKVAVSYAGETEARVKVISQLIHDNLTTPENPFPVFYAPKFQDELSGLNGMGKLLQIYRNASLVVVFLSAAYNKSPFCEEEWRAIRSRFIYGQQREQRDRLLFVKLNEFNADELRLVPDDFYIDGLKYNDQEVADLIISRWRKVEEMPLQ